MSATPEPVAVADPVEREAARLFAEHSSELLRYCRGQLGSRSEAEDALQTTFLYGCRALRRGVVPECERAWLFSIARNVCHWQRRTQARRGFAAGEADLDRVADARTTGGLEPGLGQELVEALASIPETQRRALVLREWHGLSAGEVAAQLGLAVPATYALLQRARRSLVHALEHGARGVALGLCTLVVELRASLKAMLGGGTAKAAAVAAAGVTLAVGGVSVETALGDRAPSRGDPSAEPPPGRTAAAGNSVDSEQATRSRSPLSAARAVAYEPRARAAGDDRLAAIPGADAPRAAEPAVGDSGTRHDLPAGDAVEPGPVDDLLPGVTLDPALLDAELPGVELPGVEVPGVEVPGVEVPGVAVPGVDVDGELAAVEDPLRSAAPPPLPAPELPTEAPPLGAPEAGASPSGLEPVTVVP